MSNTPLHADRIKGLFSLSVRYFKVCGLQYLLGHNALNWFYFELIKSIINKNLKPVRIISGTIYILETKKQLIDSFKKVCICRSIKAGTIMAAIKEGSLSFEALRKNIGVGTGNCKAKRCRAKIEERIKDYKESIKTT